MKKITEIKQYIFISTLLFLFSFSTIIYATDIFPIPQSIKVDKQKASLGKKLFFDPILSKDKTLSCASCHNLFDNGADKTAYTKGINGMLGYFNVPTVYNAVYNFRQFWDGRAKDLEEQVLTPIINPVEMGNSIEEVLKDLKNSKYDLLFRVIYEDGVSKENLAEVIAEFEKTLTTPNSMFDKYLKDKHFVLSPKIMNGYRLFKEKGCISCHNGVNVGGNLYNKFGIYEDANSKELGRFNITQREEDRYVFKVPSLRNVELTAPYMHDGRIKTLEEAINLMSMYQLGRKIPKDELSSMVEFLKSLTGERPVLEKELDVSND